MRLVVRCSGTTADAVSIAPTHLSIDIPNIRCMDVAKKVHNHPPHYDDKWPLIAGHMVQLEITQYHYVRLPFCFHSHQSVRTVIITKSDTN